jgi:hypothetical protein
MSSLSTLVDLTKLVQRPIKISLLLTGLITLFSVSTLFFLQPEIPIFYSLPLSSQQIVNRFWILLFPGYSLIVTLLHITLLGIFSKVDEEVLRLFCWLTVVLQLILFAILLRLLVLVL